jgi:hypothetical protein
MIEETFGTGTPQLLEQFDYGRQMKRGSIPSMAKYFYPLYIIHIGYEVHSASYVMRVGASFHADKSNLDRLCGLVVRIPGYRSRGPDSTPGATIFPEK